MNKQEADPQERPGLIKNGAEIEGMKAAGRAAALVLEMIGEHVEAGVSTNELNDLCHQYITTTLNCTPAPLNYQGFPKSICTSLNHQVCHGIPSDKRLKKGDILNIDVTVIKDGWHGDSSRMFIIGKPKPHVQRLVETCYEAMWRGIEAMRPGVQLGDIGHTIQHYAEKHRYSVVREYCGHGIGREFHEYPQVLHYGTPGEGLVLKPGMTFTIEPMINAGRRHVRVLGDRWTVITSDHSLSAQWEHTILVTETSHAVLTIRCGEQAPSHAR